MNDHTGIADLIREVKGARDNIVATDARHMRLFEEMKTESTRLGAALVDTQTKLAKVSADMAESATKLVRGRKRPSTGSLLSSTGHMVRSATSSPPAPSTSPIILLCVIR
ncbi:hypothetical protein [Bradyrhizobium uaiense]|uniref:Uncharacterized protein n=1 Tax=Bradyrhizobium uaiense TaxID=2594946 RepID=A0A6P1BCX4_9BRAD|nr:hypothetical protein [Bradyrhizobium uaiense]NEU96123.1 hypothetical protein [Bradyrhizobium uaiense]